jgi:hypothetical protein
MLVRRVLAWVFVVAVVAVPAAAQDPPLQPPFTCETESLDGCWSTWKVDVIDGPCPVACPTEDNPEVFLLADDRLACNLPDPDTPGSFGNECSAILYRVEKLPICRAPEGADASSGSEFGVQGMECSHGVATLARGPIPGALGHLPGVSVSEPCEGSPHPVKLTALAINKCRTEYCEILGFGRQIDDSCVPNCGNFNQNQATTRTEIFEFKTCLVKFEYDALTGGVLDFGLVGVTNACGAPGVGTPCCAVDSSGLPARPESENCCRAFTGNVGSLKLEIPGGEGKLPATFGEAFVSAGTDSCSCRVIGGRLYCWGVNCPR